MSMAVKSSVFQNQQPIPAKYTCQGEDISVPLSWSDPPEGAQSFALIVDDPDAPGGTWVHWVLYDLPANARELREAVPASETLDNGAKQGTNDFKRIGYGGPCPPPGATHRYFFKLYALDQKLNLTSGATKQQLLDAMKGHVKAEAQVVGTFRR